MKVSFAIKLKCLKSNKGKVFIVKRDSSILSESLQFHWVFNTEKDQAIIFSSIKTSKQTFPENDPAWKKFENRVLHFWHHPYINTTIKTFIN